MLVKIYGTAGSNRSGYSPPELIDIEKRWVMGNPDPDHISTSYIERQNLAMRTNMRRYQRLTIAHSKKMENHMAAVSLYFMHYNYCHTHSVLTKANGGIHTSPAMAAALTDRVWKVKDIVDLLSN
jgi:hypothetical protein